MTARLRIRLVLWVAFCASHAVSTSAREGDPYRSALGHAVAAKERAIDSGSQGDWAEALRRLRRANEIRETAESQYEIGFAASQLGYDDLAVEAYQRSISLGLSRAALAKAQAFVAIRAQEMGRLVIQGPKGWRLTINGVERTSLPLAEPVLVRPGRVHIALDAGTEGEDSGHWERQVEVMAGAQMDLVVELAQGESVPPPTPALQVSSSPSEVSPGALRPTPLVHNCSRKCSAGRLLPNEPRSPEAESGSGWKRSALVLSSAGTTIGVLSALFLPITSDRIRASRQGLSENCYIQIEGPDTCRYALPERQQVAQSFSDSVATWKAARTVSWVGLAVGLSAAVAGVSTYLFAELDGMEPLISPRISSDHRQVELAINGTF